MWHQWIGIRLLCTEQRLSKCIGRLLGCLGLLRIVLFLCELIWLSFEGLLAIVLHCFLLWLIVLVKTLCEIDVCGLKSF